MPEKAAAVWLSLYHVLRVNSVTTLPDKTGRPVHLLDDTRRVEVML